MSDKGPDFLVVPPNRILDSFDPEGAMEFLGDAFPEYTFSTADYLPSDESYYCIVYLGEVEDQAEIDATCRAVVNALKAFAGDGEYLH